MFLRRTVLAMICPFIHDPFNTLFVRSFVDSFIQTYTWSIVSIHHFYLLPSLHHMYVFTGFPTSRVSTVVSQHFDSVLTTNHLPPVIFLDTGDFPFAFCQQLSLFVLLIRLFHGLSVLPVWNKNQSRGKAIVLYFSCRLVYLTFPQLRFDQTIAFPYANFYQFI